MGKFAFLSSNRAPFPCTHVPPVVVVVVVMGGWGEGGFLQRQSAFGTNLRWGQGTWSVPLLPISVYRLKSECVSVKNNPLEPPPSCSGISPAKGGCPGQPSTREITRERKRDLGDVWEAVRRYWESPERKSALLHPCLWLGLPNSPLSTLLGAWERHSSSWLPQPFPPSRSLQTQSLLSPSLRPVPCLS